MGNRLIIFPVLRQIIYLADQSIADKIYVIYDDELPDEKLPDFLHIFSSECREIISELQKTEMDVLCCHEEAIYWLRNNISPLWKCRFSEKYLELLDKSVFKDYLNGLGISNAGYVKDAHDIESYPVVAKPSIGFGSICVCRIDNHFAAMQYNENFNLMVVSSPIYKYNLKYFSDMINRPVFEELIDGDFFRTPLIISGGICKYLFPVKGRQNISNDRTNYHWEDFELDPEDKSINRSQMRDIINRLADDLKLADGSYVAEFMQGKDDRVYMLEFSPRQTSERIGHIIKLSYGIDVETEAIRMFLYNGDSPKAADNPRAVRLRLEGEGCKLSPLSDYYSLIDSWHDSSLYTASIFSNFYTKGSSVNEKE